MNPLRWPLWGKAIAVALIALATSGGLTLALTPRGRQRASQLPAAVPASSSAGYSPSAPLVASPAAVKLGATCQVTSDGSPASQQDYDPGDLGYAVSVVNGSGSAVTITGYVVTFTAYS